MSFAATLLASCLFLLICPFLVYESIRFYSHASECRLAQEQNTLLLQNPLCSDPWQRHVHGPKQEAVCEKARVENQVPFLLCAWQHMWLKGEANRVWLMITESYWMLLGIIVPCLVAAIAMVFWTCEKRASRHGMYDFQREMYRETLSMIGRNGGRQLQQQYPQLIHNSGEEYLEYEEPMREKRQQRKYVQLIARE